MSTKYKTKPKKITDNNLCLKCPIRGRCCYYHTFINGYQVETDEKCMFLKDNGICSIYNERERNPHCLSIEEMKKQGTLLPQCLYIKDDQEYLKRTDRRIPREAIKVILSLMEVQG